MKQALTSVRVVQAQKTVVFQFMLSTMVWVSAGLYCSSLATRLTHLCDTVIGLEAVRDNSDIVRIIPDAAR